MAEHVDGDGSRSSGGDPSDAPATLGVEVKGSPRSDGRVVARLREGPTTLRLSGGALRSHGHVEIRTIGLDP